MTKPSATSEFLIEVFVTGIGWAFFMAMAAGFYWLGSWAAGYFGEEQHRDTFGTLSVIVFFWINEHRLAEELHGRLRERMDEAASAAHWGLGKEANGDS